MKRLLIALSLVLAACGSSDAGSTLLSQTTASLPDLGDTTTSSTEPPPPPVVSCATASFVPSELPERVADERPDVSTIPFDLYTTISGTSTSVWSQEGGEPVVVIIRGALPPVRWVTTPEVIEVRGVDAALGELPDGYWGVAWFEGPDRCDEYSIILYPPADAEEVRLIAESLVEGERLP